MTGKWFKASFGKATHEEWMVYTKEQPAIESIVTVEKKDGTTEDVRITDTQPRTRVVGKPLRQKTITSGWGSRWDRTISHRPEVGATRSNTVGETTQQEQQQYVTIERYKKLVEYVNQITANFNQLSETVEQLKNWELTRQRIENEKMEAQKRKRFNGRNQALEADAGGNLSAEL